MTSRTKLVSLTTPHNPTGQVMTEAALREVVRIVEAHPRARLLVDETYREMTFAGPLPLAASLVRAGHRRVVAVQDRRTTGDPDRLAHHDGRRPPGPVPGGQGADPHHELGRRRGHRRGGHRPPAGPPARRSSTGSQTALETVRGWMADQDLFEWVEPRGGVVGFPRFRAGIQVDVDAFYRILLERHGTLVGPGHWFDQPRRHFRLGYGWPGPIELEQGLAALAASAVEAWDGPRVRSDRRMGAAIGNALLEMDRQIFRDVPRVEEMVKAGGETVGLSGDGGLVVRLPATEPADEAGRTVDEAGPTVDELARSPEPDDRPSPDGDRSAT